MPKRDYKNKYASVTTVLGVLRKIGLEFWFKNNTKEFCDEKSKKGREIGTHTHDAIQSFIETGSVEIETEYEEEVTTALKSFQLFREEHPEIELLKCEQALTSEKYQFNGTIDIITNEAIGDWKTGEAKDKEKPTIYDEYIYQVSAYVYLWNETQNANIEKAWIVSIAKDKVAYNYLEIPYEVIKESFENVFLSALNIHKTAKVVKKLLKESKK
jgi:hypothetical protein